MIDHSRADNKIVGSTGKIPFSQMYFCRKDGSICIGATAEFLLNENAPFTLVGRKSIVKKIDWKQQLGHPPCWSLVPIRQPASTAAAGTFNSTKFISASAESPQVFDKIFFDDPGKKNGFAIHISKMCKNVGCVGVDEYLRFRTSEPAYSWKSCFGHECLIPLHKKSYVKNHEFNLVIKSIEAVFEETNSTGSLCSQNLHVSNKTSLHKDDLWLYMSMSQQIKEIVYCGARSVEGSCYCTHGQFDDGGSKSGRGKVGIHCEDPVQVQYLLQYFYLHFLLTAIFCTVLF